VALMVVLAACASPSGQRSTVSSQQGSAVPRQRDYWPTNGWRTAPPQAEGMDPAVLATIPGNVASLHPEVRSVLVVPAPPTFRTHVRIQRPTTTAVRRL
jgi:hypothetical protein